MQIWNGLRTWMRTYTGPLLVIALFATMMEPLSAAPRQTSGAIAPIAQETPTPEAQSDAVTTTLDQMDSLLIDLADQLDRSQFDLDELSFSLGFDPEEIIDFVRENIAFEQYPGLLRGAQGTLMSRAGNALDQALLLQTLLVDAGYDAQIAHGALSPAQATRLLRQMNLPRKAAPAPVKDIAQVQEILGQMITLGGVDQTAKDTLIKQLQAPPAVDESVQYQQTISQTNFLLDTLEANHIELGDAGAASKLRAEAQDYFWVDYRLGPADPWTQAHPAFKSGGAPSDLEATEHFEGEIPATLQQRLQLQVSIERSNGVLTETVPIMDPWQGAAADLSGQPHSFALYADGLTDSANYADLHTAYAATHYYFPLVDGKLPAGALFFDTSGKTVTPEEASSPFSQIGGAISSAIGNAISAFGPETTTVEANQLSKLTAVYMDYTFFMPDGSQKTQRRVIWQQGDTPITLGDKLTADETYEMGRQLTASYDFMLATGAYPAAYRLDQTINQLLNMRPLFNTVAANIVAQETAAQETAGQEIAAQEELTPTAASAVAAPPLPTSGWTGHLSIFAIFDLLPSSKGALSYLSEPMLVQHRQTLGDGSLVQAGIDIVNNGRRAYRSAGRDLLTDAKEVLRAGVWETLTEGLVLPDDVTDRQNTETVFAAAQAQGIPVRVLTPEMNASLATMKWNDATKAAVRRDLAAGYLVVAPNAAPSGATLMAWWRLDPSTGETLGMGETPTGGGGGVEMVEYVMLIQSSVGTFGCLAISSSDPNGLSTRDLVVCAGTGLVSSFGPGGAILGGSKLGVVVVAAVGAVLADFVAGFWLNTSPGLDTPIM